MRCEPMLIITVVFFLLMVSAFPVLSQGNEYIESPGGNNSAEIEMDEDGFEASVIHLFKRHVSPIDGDRCPMYPSCSQYSLEASNKHGLLMGWIMTCDRLLRCGGDGLKTAPRITVDGRTRCYDSVEENDFWWAE